MRGKRSGDHDITPAQAGAVLMATQNHNARNTDVAKDVGCSEGAVRGVKKRVLEKADKENIAPLQAANAKQPRGLRPPKLNVRERRCLIRHAIKNKANRRKPWSMIAQECGIEASMTAIRHALELSGYGRYPPRYKPPLTDAQKRGRLEFCIEMLEKDSDWWRKVVWTHETPIRVGAHRGQVWITRKKGEAFQEDCVNVRFKKYSDLQFWGCFSTEMRGPYHIYATETAAEKKAAPEDLNDFNSTYHVEAQLLNQRFQAEQLAKPPSERLKKPLKPDTALKTRGKNLKGGVDWYRYREEVLRSKLLPLCKRVIEAYEEC